MNYIVEYEGGVLHCPHCGRLLGSFKNTWTRLKDQCGAYIEIDAKDSNSEPPQ